MNDEPQYTVGEIAELLGISIRQLHHWDSLGLAPASDRSFGGYRLYDTAAVERLQQALLYRETGMSLAAIKEILDSGQSRREHLIAQRKLLLAQQNQLAQKLCAVEKFLEDMMTDTPLSIHEKAEILGKEWNPEWEAEAEERWGDTQDWKVSYQRQAAMSAQDWQRLQASMAQVEAAMVEGINAGVDPTSAHGIELAEKHRHVISTFFDVTHAKHVIIARGYLADERFKAYYTKRHPDLPTWLVAAINANAAHHGVDPQQAQWG